MCESGEMETRTTAAHKTTFSGGWASKRARRRSSPLSQYDVHPSTGSCHLGLDQHAGLAHHSLVRRKERGRERARKTRGAGACVVPPSRSPPTLSLFPHLTHPTHRDVTTGTQIGILRGNAGGRAGLALVGGPAGIGAAGGGGGGGGSAAPPTPLVLSAQAGKRHGMIKRTRKFIRDARGTTTLSAPDAKIVKQYMPYDR